MSLRNTFIHLVSDELQVQDAPQRWEEIVVAYSHKSRHYHNLAHLENLLVQLNQVKTEITDWNTILFTLFYHDIVYKSLKNDNEEQSAKLAEKRMQEMNLPLWMIEKCKEQILATKGHQVSPNSDTNYFTDADLSILGAEWDVYQKYAIGVRREYDIYPDLIYNPGRKKVLKHFLEMERLYKTPYFYDKFETQAKRNLKKELSCY